MINNRFLFFKTKEAFEAAKNNGDVSQDSIVFIKNDKVIWTHGTYFDGDSAQFLTQEEYDELENPDENTTYFIYDIVEEEDQ